MTSSRRASRSTTLDVGRLPAHVGNASEVDGHADVARLVLAGPAASMARDDIRGLRTVLGLAIDAMRAERLSSSVFVTPAGYINLRLNGRWLGTRGWDTSVDDYERLGAIAADAAEELVVGEPLVRAQGVVRHLVIGVDVSPTSKNEPHAEVACLVDVGTGAVVPITGKSYPTIAQERSLVRNLDVASHIVSIGDEQVAVLVCHDLSAWSPRGNAVAKHRRADTWKAMQEAVRVGNPTLAVHLTHTAHNAATWQSAWARFEKLVGGQLRTGASAIRHLDQRWKPVEGPLDGKLLAGTNRGRPALDVIVGEDC